MLDQPLKTLPGQVQPVELGVAPLEFGDDAQRLGIVVEAAMGLQHLVQGVLARMAERRVTEIVNEGDAFGEVLVELEGTRQGAGDLRHFDRVRQPRPIVVAVGSDEDLCLVLQPAKGRRVDDAIAIALEIRTCRARRFRIEPAARRPGVRRERRVFTITEAQRIFVECHFPPKSSSH